MDNNEIKPLIERIIELEEKNQKLMKSISSSTAILAAVVIIELIVTIASLFIH